MRYLVESTSRKIGGDWAIWLHDPWPSRPKLWFSCVTVLRC